MNKMSDFNDPSSAQVARNLTDFCTSRVFSDLSVLLRMLSSSDRQRIILSFLYLARRDHLPPTGLTLEELGSTLTLPDILSLLNENCVRVGLRLYSPSEIVPYGSQPADGELQTGGEVQCLRLSATRLSYQVITLPIFSVNGAGDRMLLGTLAVGLL